MNALTRRVLKRGTWYFSSRRMCYYSYLVHWWRSRRKSLSSPYPPMYDNTAVFNHLKRIHLCMVTLLSLNATMYDNTAKYNYWKWWTVAVSGKQYAVKNGGYVEMLERWAIVWRNATGTDNFVNLELHQCGYSNECTT